MTEDALLLIGAGGHAKSCIDLIESQGKYRISGLVGTKEEISKTVFGYRIIATDEDLAGLAKLHPNALVAVGQIESPNTRIRLHALATDSGFQMPAIISPNASVSRHANIGEGSVVMPGVIINAGADIGKNCIINTGAIIDHDVMIGDHCHISTGAILNGNVRIGMACFIGSGAILRENIQVGDTCFIGMAARLTKDCSANTRYILHR